MKLPDSRVLFCTAWILAWMIQLPASYAWVLLFFSSPTNCYLCLASMEGRHVRSCIIRLFGTILRAKTNDRIQSHFLSNIHIDNSHNHVWRTKTAPYGEMKKHTEIKPKSLRRKPSTPNDCSCKLTQWLAMVCKWSSNGWPMVGRLLANGWPMAGQWFANCWPMVDH